MSDPRYAPYGADDDPFLTHPAGPGQRYARARSARPGSQNWQGDVPDQAYDRDPRYGAYGADYGPGEDADHDLPWSFAQPPRASQQQGNFRPRPAAPPVGHLHAAQGAAPLPHSAQDAFDGWPHRPAPLDRQEYARSPVPPQQHRQPAGQTPMGVQGGRGLGFAPPQAMGGDHRHAPRGGYPDFPQADFPHMANDSAHLAHGFAVSGPKMGQILQWAGAVCTIMAVLGAGYWGYNLAVRDAQGIPVVRAASGPLRVVPEQPGGEVSAHQGLSVNAIPAAGLSTPVSDQIILAPQTANLSPEDTLIEEGSFVENGVVGAGTAALAGASDMALALPQTGGGISAELIALPDALPEDLPLTDAEAVERALAAALAEGSEALSDAAPMALPAAMEPASMSNLDPLAPPTAEMDPANIAPGTPLVQFGAFDTAEMARAEWAMLQTRFTELMAGKALVVEQAKSGGRDFYRLRAHGFETTDDTRRFCHAILAENGTCLTVDQR